MFTTNMRQSDAIPQSFNRYAYTQNDPVNATDPSGLQSCFDASCGSGGFGGWGGSIIGNGPHFGGPGVIAGAAANHDALVQARIDGRLAQHYANEGNFAAASQVLNRNPNVGVYVDGVALWGRLGAAYAEGYGAYTQIAALGLPDLRGPIQAGLKKTYNLLRSLRSPDFYILNIATPAQVSVAITRGGGWGDKIIGLGGGLGLEASGFAGWMMQMTQPDKDTIRGYLSGWAWSLDVFVNPWTGGGAGVGLGYMRSPMNDGTRGALLLGLGAGGGFAAGYGDTEPGWNALTRKYFP